MSELPDVAAPATPIAVTGATGNLGGRVARLLAAAGVPQRLVVREAARAPGIPAADVAEADFGDFDAVRRALWGCPTVLMVSASETADRVEQHHTFVDAAAAARVEHLVYVSFYGASPDATFTLARDHAATEEHIAASGMGWTMLRDNMYLEFFPLLADGEGVIRGPAGDGQVAAVSQDDIAACAAVVLQDPAAHLEQTYSLTGPEAFTLTRAAEVLSAAHGRPFRYEPETVEQAYASRGAYGAPDWQVEAWVSTYTAIAAGELAGVTDDVRQLTGRVPLSLEQVLARR